METFKYTKSHELFGRAAKVIPGGIYGHQGPANGCFIPNTAFPYFSERAKGAYFWDVDGNRFIDYMCAYGPNLLGYCDDDVDNAAIEQARISNCVTAPSAKLIEFAETLVDTVDMADWAFFMKNGGDATTFAIMIARAATNRKKVILVRGNYHGVAPWAQGIGCGGVIEEDVANVLYVDWNDAQQVEDLIKRYPGEIACFMSTPYWHGNFAENALPAEGYWQAVRKLCTDNGIVLAIDDVRCGFRLDIAGSDKYFGFKADLMCFCKAIANGWNVSAICGADSLKSAATEVFYTGSYWLSAAPFAAGLACIEKMKKLGGPGVLHEYGKKLTDGLVRVAKMNGCTLIVSGAPSMFYLRIADDPSLSLHQRWVAECVKRGVYITNHHNHFINYAMTDEDIKYTLEVADEAFHAIRAGR
ncbi:MAG: aminotransferase class III-fold pyridoxal phosphate-dependent enzyme [Burkholderiales bacterium]